MALKQTVLYIVAALFLCLSCGTDGCLDNQNAIPLAGFYDSASGSSISISNMQVSGVGAPGDSILQPAGRAISQLYLPMRSTADKTEWCLHYVSADNPDADTDAFNDTIAFEYDSREFFASEECGAMYLYEITHVRYTTHLVDSVVVTDSLITNVDLERIRIYFKTADDNDAPEQ